MSLALSLALFSCSGGGGGTGPDAETDVAIDVPGDLPSDDVIAPAFDDHTVGSFESTEDLLSWAKNDQVPAQAKFVITNFSTEGAGRVHWLNMEFYSLHDEWFWFTLLNGQPIPGLDVDPIDAGPFATIADVYATFTPDSDLPLGLKYYGERLYSPGFYHLGLYEDPRFFGLGSVLHYPANPNRVVPEELWVFELEFTDEHVDAEILDTFFHRLEAALPTDIQGELRWLVRSVEQELLAESIRADGGPYAQRILTYDDLVVTGEVVGYNPGITAGRIARFDKGAIGVSLMASDQIVVLEAVPDDLPPVAGIVTAVPQTPRAHINLLAQSRGTPNVYVAGVMGLEWLDDYEDWGTKAILKVTEDAVLWKGISDE
ncbi:MAG: hypothetical protein VX938_09645, partial [Myxococcota bacterium]|nr:hypothetical protein [Myxococcota bacterium]